MRTVAIEVIVNAARQDHLGPFRAVRQNDTAVPRIARTVVQGLAKKYPRLPWVMFSLLQSWLVAQHLRRNHHGYISIQKRYLIRDCRHMPLVKGNQGTG